MSDTQNIYQKLQAVQSELKAPKGQHNSFGNYDYRSAEDIIEAAKPVLAKHGLALVITDQVMNIGNRYYVMARAGLYEQEGVSGVYADGYAREEETKKGMDGAQITGAASSYARKYALNGLFAIDDTKDADSRDNRQAAPTKPTAPKAKPAMSYVGSDDEDDKYVTAGQAALILSRARDASGLTDKVEVMDWFIGQFDMQASEVKRGDLQAVLAQLSAMKGDT